MNARQIKLLPAVAAVGLIAAVSISCDVVGPPLFDTSVKMDSSSALLADSIDQSTKTKGVTTVTWDSSFQFLNYNVGDPLTFTVNWHVDAGFAEYDAADGFELRKVTPAPRRDPAQGTLDSATQVGTSVQVQFTFSDLHLDDRRNVDIGNAHLKLYLWVDEDGDNVVDSRVGYGVNVHVEDPQL